MIPRLLQAFWRFRYLGKSCGVGFGIQYYTKVYYTETKSTFKTFGTENNATFAVEKENKSYTVDIEQKSKINQLLLSATPKGLLFSEWLKRNGYSDQLIKDTGNPAGLRCCQRESCTERETACRHTPHCPATTGNWARRSVSQLILHWNCSASTTMCLWGNRC